jgi:hypothetical protein
LRTFAGPAQGDKVAPKAAIALIMSRERERERILSDLTRREFGDGA